MMQLSTHATVQRAACASITKRSPARLLLRPNPDATRHPSSSVLLKASSPGSDAADGVAKSYVDLGSRQLYDRSSVRCGFHPEDGKEGKTSTKTDLENPDKKTVQRHVILAIDESKESEAMVDWAFNNVLREGDTADLVHIISAVPGGMVFRIPGQPSLYRVPSSKQKSHGLLVSQDDYLQEQNEAIQSKFVYQAEMSKVHLQTHVVCSSVANSKAKLGKIINNIATDAHGSAVLVSSHSKGGLTEVLIGSVADWLVHNCKTPLIVLHGVPHSENAKGEGEEEKSDTLPELREGRKLLVAVDTSQASMDACKWVVENIYRQGDHVYLYHMVPFIPPEAFSVFDFSALVNATPVDRAVFKALDPFEEMMMEEEEWLTAQQSRFGAMFHEADVPFTLMVESEYTLDPTSTVAEKLVCLSDQMDASALVLTSHLPSDHFEELIFGSVTNTVAHKCKKPVVVLHSTSTEA